MARRKFSCDFETTTDPLDCRVWAYGWMEVFNRTNYKIGTSMDEFMEWVMEVKSDIYFHNLKFDGSFIINWLLKNGFEFSKSGRANTFNAIISGMGQWYMIDISFGYKGNGKRKKKVHTVLYDSLKKLPFKVSKIAKDFKLPIVKGDIDYHKPRPIGYIPDEQETEYIKYDVEIIARALEIQFNQGLTRMTTGSDSLRDFKNVISTKVFDRLFPPVSLQLDEELRFAYKGGFTWLNEMYRERDVSEGIVFDVNSLYPYVMYHMDLPYGEPIAYEGKYEQDDEYPLYIQRLKCEFYLKDDKIPTIQIKKNLIFRENEYLKHSQGEHVELNVTNVDWELIQEHYHVENVQYIKGWKFRKNKGFFKQFIDKWTYVKTHEEGAKKLLAKLMLNSLYGKFATNPDITGKVPYLKEDGSNGFMGGEKEMKDPVYLPMGIFITSWARFTTITTAQKCFNRIIYCDTDSIHLVGTEIPEAIRELVHPKKLGFWKYEYTFKRAKYIRQKTYLNDIYAKEVVNEEGEKKIVYGSKEESTMLKMSVKCAGMTDKVKENVTWENFKVGFTSRGKLLQKQVSGGVVLVDTEFTLKG